MIVDNISNAHLYYGLSPAIEKSLKFLASTDLTAMQDGKHPIDTGITIGINQYSTKDSEQGVLEAHRKNIDVQYLIRGAEKIGYAFLNQDAKAEPSTEYDEKRDIQFFGKKCETFILNEGMFSIFFPSDLHMPGLKIGEPAPVRKAVIKIAI